MTTSTKEARFIAIVNDNRGILFKVIRAYCRNSEDWKDLEQEIVIQLWKSFDSYDPQYRLSTWMYRIALNVAISHFRKNDKRRNDTGLDDAIFQVADDDRDQLDTNRARLYDFISTLDEFSKALIILHLEDYSQREISQIMGITETNVGTRINRIKNKFRSIVQKDKQHG